MSRFDLLFGVGLLAMLFSLFLVTTTFATNDYTGILLTAGVSAIVSVTAFSWAAVRGTTRQRVLVIVAALPILYILSDIVRRLG